MASKIGLKSRVKYDTFTRDQYVMSSCEDQSAVYQLKRANVTLDKPVLSKDTAAPLPDPHTKIGTLC